jgi:hypothetical protein
MRTDFAFLQYLPDRPILPEDRSGSEPVREYTVPGYGIHKNNVSEMVYIRELHFNLDVSFFIYFKRAVW